MVIFDLTLKMSESFPVYPGDFKPEIKQVSTVKETGWNKKELRFSSHFGTHIDAPYHKLEKGRKLDEYPIETFIGKAIVLDVRNQNLIEHDLKEVKKNDIVFFYTNQTDKVYSDKYYENSPELSRRTAQKLIEKKVKIIGIDAYSPDNQPHKIHDILLEKGILIVENLTNLDKLLDKRFTAYIFPLKIENADGAPCRVIGILNN